MLLYRRARNGRVEKKRTAKTTKTNRVESNTTPRRFGGGIVMVRVSLSKEDAKMESGGGKAMVMGKRNLVCCWEEYVPWGPTTVHAVLDVVPSPEPNVQPCPNKPRSLSASRPLSRKRSLPVYLETQKTPIKLQKRNAATLRRLSFLLPRLCPGVNDCCSGAKKTRRPSRP